MSVVVRRPVGSHAGWRPNVAVTRFVAPNAILVEVFVTDQVARHVLRGRRSVGATIAITAPTLKFVGARRRDVLVAAQAAAREAVSLACIDRIGRALAVDLAATAAHDDGRRIVHRVDIDPIAARLACGKREIRRRHFHRLLRSQLPHAHIQRALIELYLCDVVIEIEQREAGVFTHADYGASHLEFNA